MSPAIGKLVVCGVGLIGGSFALALRQAGQVGTVVGIGRSQKSLQQAADLKVIDAIARDWAEALEGADLVLLATPVGQMEPLMKALVPHLGPRTLVTDGGSTKRDVVAAARRQFGARVAQFVPSHPIAGAEKSGVAASAADLYRGRRVVMTPLPENAPGDVARVRAAWEACGASVAEMTADEHDRVFAAVSHLPHLLAFALVHELARRPSGEGPLRDGAVRILHVHVVPDMGVGPLHRGQRAVRRRGRLSWVREWGGSPRWNKRAAD